MGREVLEGLHVFPKPAAPIIQENQQTDHFPSRQLLRNSAGACLPAAQSKPLEKVVRLSPAADIRMAFQYVT